MKIIKKFIDEIPYIKLLLFLVLIGALQFAMINLKVWQGHPADQPLQGFILGKWVAVNNESTDLIGMPLEIDFIDSNDVYFEREFPELYESMQRDYKLIGNRIEHSPSARMLVDWYISRAGEELVIGDVNYRRVITLPWGTIAIILLVCVGWGIKFASNTQTSVNNVSDESVETPRPPKWAKFAGLLLTPLLAWIGFQVGLWGFRKIVALHWREPWTFIYAVELLILIGILSVKCFKLNWKLRISDIVNPWVSLAFLLIVIVATSVFFFSLSLVSWVLLGN